jgi:hypothetical protein
MIIRLLVVGATVDVIRMVSTDTACLLDCMLGGAACAISGRGGER